MLVVENLVKTFDDNTVLKGISTSFEKGKTNLIIGQSGSGKTVFLKCLLGLFQPTSGRILYDDIDSSKLSKEELQLIRTQIGTVFQGSALFDSMTVFENVRFPLEMFLKMSNSEMDDRVAHVLKRVNLDHAHSKLPSEISGGMQKRTAIARAVVHNPKFLFCDEPNSGLDPFTSGVIDELIHEITVEYKTTTVVNTHDMNSVMEIGEKIVFLKNGILEWEGTKDTILNADNQNVIDFVYSSKLFKKLREGLLKEKP